jgi:hypothetical protein
MCGKKREDEEIGLQKIHGGVVGKDDMFSLA